MSIAIRIVAVSAVLSYVGGTSLKREEAEVALSNTSKPTHPFPPGFLGSWIGTPDASMLGPFSGPYNLIVQPLPSSMGEGWLMSDTMGSKDASMSIDGSWMHFYVNKGALDLVYCGDLKNYAHVGDKDLVRLPFAVSAYTNTSVTWCSANNTGLVPDCTFAQWTLTYDETAETLESSLLMGPPIIHLHVLFHRNSSAVVKTSDTIAPSDDIQKRALADAQLQPCHYDFAAGKPSAFASGGQMCPYAKKKANEEAWAKKHHQGQQALDDSYQYCVNLNKDLGVQLRWTFDNVSELLHMAVSAKADATSWIGIGFNPMFPSMYNADVVSGHATDTGGPGCVVPLYAAESIGAPQPNPLFNISNTSVSIVDNTLTMTFTRAFKTGYTYLPTSPTADTQLMWAIGPYGSPAQGDSGATTPPPDCSGLNYHGMTRGYRAVTLGNPFNSILPNWMC